MKQFPNAPVPVRNRVALGMACRRCEKSYGAIPEQPKGKFSSGRPSLLRVGRPKRPKWPVFPK